MSAFRGVFAATCPVRPVIRPTFKPRPVITAAQKHPSDRRTAPHTHRAARKKAERSPTPASPSLLEQQERGGPSSASGNSCSKLTSLNRYRALVLDSTYQPIDVVNWQRALCLEIAGNKVDVLEYYEDVKVKAPRDEFLLPAVVRVRYFSRRGRKGGGEMRLALNRHNIFMRDNFQCQYCGSEQNLTLDHVVPSSLGGGNSWENLVTCCSRCNSVKGSKTLAELRWKLKSKPREPSPYELTMLIAQWGGKSNPKAALPQQWQVYLEPLMARSAARQQQCAPTWEAPSAL